MSMRHSISHTSRPSVFLALLVLLFAALALAGGSYRSDAPGQVVVRFVAGIMFVVGVLTVPRPVAENRGPFLLLAAIALVPLVQLVPLPPAWWKILPGRGALAHAIEGIGQDPVWRPLSWSPGTTLNALFSLIVPAAMLLLMAGVKQRERGWLLGLFLAMVAGVALVGLIQFSGNRFDQPLIRYDNQVSGVFANRNHFALFLALGCLATPAWALSDKRKASVSVPVGIGLIIVLALTILASGSRAGMAMAGIAIAIGPLVVREDIRRLISGWPRWLAPVIAIGMLALLAGAVALSASAGRAQAIDRLITADVSSDMRARSLPTVLSMTHTYFPAGIGMGSFDVAFRHHEPFALLKLTYFNQAHDDVLSVILEGGLPGLIVLVMATVWWARGSMMVWPARAYDGALVRARLGSAMLAFVFAASIVDYPARTPTIMAVVALASAWLSWGWYSVRRP